jgi:hypothetical protein
MRHGSFGGAWTESQVKWRNIAISLTTKVKECNGLITTLDFRMPRDPDFASLFFK